MELVKLEIEVPKEMNDVRLFLVQLVNDIVAKKGVTEIIASSLPSLITAVDGFQKLSEEAKAKEAYNLYGLLAADLAKSLAK